MERYRTYFKWAGGLAIAYAGLLVAGGVTMTASLGPSVYEAASPTATQLFEIYGSKAAAVAVQLEIAAWSLLAAALPAFALYLSRRTPGLAWGGLAVGGLAIVVSLIAFFVEAMAYRLGAAGEGASMLALVPPGDVVLFFNLLAEALALPMLAATYAWFLVWGLAFFRAGSRLARAAAVAFALTVALFFVSLVGFAAASPLLANGAVFFQTLAQAAAFALGGVALMVAAKTPK
jgi:hypothetical protein